MIKISLPCKLYRNAGHISMSANENTGGLLVHLANPESISGGGGGGTVNGNVTTGSDSLWTDDSGTVFIYRDSGATPPVFTAYLIPAGTLYTVGTNPRPYISEIVEISNALSISEYTGSNLPVTVSNDFLTLEQLHALPIDVNVGNNFLTYNQLVSTPLEVNVNNNFLTYNQLVANPLAVAVQNSFLTHAELISTPLAVNVGNSSPLAVSLSNPLTNFSLETGGNLAKIASGIGNSTDSEAGSGTGNYSVIALLKKLVDSILTDTQLRASAIATTVSNQITGFSLESGGNLDKIAAGIGNITDTKATGSTGSYSAISLLKKLVDGLITVTYNKYTWISAITVMSSELTSLANTASVTGSAVTDNSTTGYTECEVVMSMTGSAAGNTGLCYLYLLGGVSSGSLATVTKTSDMRYIGSIELNGTTAVQNLLRVKNLPPYFKFYLTNSSLATLASGSVTISPVRLQSAV